MGWGNTLAVHSPFDAHMNDLCTAALHRSDSTYWLIWMLSNTCSSSLDVHRKLQMRHKTLWRCAKFLLIWRRKFASCMFLALIGCRKIFQIETRFDLPAFFFFFTVRLHQSVQRQPLKYALFLLCQPPFIFSPCKFNRKSGKLPIFEY